MSCWSHWRTYTSTTREPERHCQLIAPPLLWIQPDIVTSLNHNFFSNELKKKLFSRLISMRLNKKLNWNTFLIGTSIIIFHWDHPIFTDFFRLNWLNKWVFQLLPDPDQWLNLFTQMFKVDSQFESTSLQHKSTLFFCRNCNQSNLYHQELIKYFKYFLF